MRSMFLVLTALSLSVSAFASDNMVEYFKAVTSSEALAQTLAQPELEGFQVKGIDKTMDFRCPGCYQFTVKVEKFDNEAGKVKRKTFLLVTNLDLASKMISVASPIR